MAILGPSGASDIAGMMRLDLIFGGKYYNSEEILISVQPRIFYLIEFVLISCWSREARRSVPGSSPVQARGEEAASERSSPCRQAFDAENEGSRSRAPVESSAADESAILQAQLILAESSW